MCKKNCLECHFFSYVQMHGMLPQSVTFDLRGGLQEDNGKVWGMSWCCYKGVWHENSFNTNTKRGEIFFAIINKDRSDKKNSRENSCFYMQKKERQYKKRLVLIENR